MINLTLDFGPIKSYMDVADAHQKVLASGRTQSAMTIAMGITAASAFNQHMDQLAEGQESRFGHVYEWGMVGEHEGHLWRMVLAGAGNTRLLDYIWVASKKVVPVGPRSESLGGGPSIDGDTRKAVHVFRWKAPMTEYGVPVTISPNGSNVLAFPTGSTQGGAQGIRTNGGMSFSNSPVRPRVNNEARGQFTAAWAQFFIGGVASTMPEQEEMEYNSYMKVDFTNKVINRIRSGSKPVPRANRIFVDIKPKQRLGALSAQVTEEYFQRKLARAEALRRLASMD